jgi:hypothetical protein
MSRTILRRISDFIRNFAVYEIYHFFCREIKKGGFGADA